MKTILFAVFLAALAVLFLTILSCRQDNTVQTVPPEETTPPGSGTTILPGIPTISTSPTSLYGKKLVYYAQVNKAGDYFRRMLIDSASAVRVRQTGTLPENALLVLETWFGSQQSTVYGRQKVAGEWHSTSFSPTQPNYMVSLESSCNGCHATARQTDAAFTLPLLQKSLARNAVQTIECNQSSFTPCDLSVYQGQ